jgi:hypothetical protein
MSFKVGDNVRTIASVGNSKRVLNIKEISKRRTAVRFHKEGDWYDAERYELVPEVNPYAALSSAFLAGKPIECLQEDGWAVCDWPNFDQPVEEYRIKLEDPYKELKVAYANGKTIQVSGLNGGDWEDINPHWIHLIERYRIKPEPELIPHIYCEEMIAFAQGYAIQVWCDNGEEWVEAKHPVWIPTCTYRVKPQRTTEYWAEKESRLALMEMDIAAQRIFIADSENFIREIVRDMQILKDAD